MTKTAVTVNERPLSALDAIYGRRSVRSYTSQTLEKSTVRALLDAAVQAPTAMSGQPWVFVVVQDRQLLKRLSDRVKAMWVHDATPAHARAPRRGAGFHEQFIRSLENSDFNVFHDAGTLVVICARGMDRFVIGDCWLAAENLMLAACALGLGTCCIGGAVAALETPELKSALGIPADVHPVAPIVVGAPAGGATPVARAAPEIVSWM